MDSPRLDSLDGELQPMHGLLDDFFPACCKQTGSSMDVELPDLLLPGLDDADLGLAPIASARPAAGDRAELLRAALRSHQDVAGLDAPVEAALAARPAKPAPLKAEAVAPPSRPAPQQQLSTSSRRAASAGDVVKSEPVQSLTAHDVATSDADSDAPGGSSRRGGGAPKRRRRIRNAKQQELNRLAQQRYRERKKQKYTNLQGTVDELSSRLGQLSTLETANAELSQRNAQLETVVKEQQVQLTNQQETIARQAQQLQTQAQQLHQQAQQLQTQVQRIEQQDRQMAALRSGRAAAGGAAQQGAPGAAAADAEPLNDQLSLAVRAVLTGVGGMASAPAGGKDAAQMQAMVPALPDALLQQIRSCCREVFEILKKTEVKEQPHAIQVPCC